MSFFTITNNPDSVLIQDNMGWAEMQNSKGTLWTKNQMEVMTKENNGELFIELSSEQVAIKRIALKWKRRMEKAVQILGDHWERGYGELEWRGIVPERILPWYFLTYDGKRTHGYGVKTGPKAMCFWQVNEEEITLCLDVRCGGAGVVLKDKRLQVATIHTREGMENESPFQAARALCKGLCELPLMPKKPAYGGNNWYYAYGKSSHKQILEDSKLISSLAASTENRPFMVIDDGWQICHYKSFIGGPWNSGNSMFPDMKKLADEMKQIGTKPGIWLRPLMTSETVPESWLLPETRFKVQECCQFLDPSHPEVLDFIRRDIERLVAWGYDLIKHDFSTYDILGRWGFDMDAELTNEGWHFYDRSKTTAEVITDLYTTIRKAAGTTTIIGCNTVAHISAGIFEIQRTGDDTSGVQWERTRKMGINTLAFRMPQHGTFFAADADCVGISDSIPWSLNKQWLDLLSRSGTPIFVSVAPKDVDAAMKRVLSKAFDIAAKPIPAGEPLDWLQSTCPKSWLLNGEKVEFNWHRQDVIDFCK